MNSLIDGQRGVADVPLGVVRGLGGKGDVSNGARQVGRLAGAFEEEWLFSVPRLTWSSMISNW
jgi:hypothetical protein